MECETIPFTTGAPMTDHPSIAFTIALRRNPGVPATWRLRFEVHDGAFILHTERAGVQVDGPPLAGGALDLGPEVGLQSTRLRLVDLDGSLVATYRVALAVPPVPGRWAPLRPGPVDADGTVSLVQPGEPLPEDSPTVDQLAIQAREAAPPARLVKHLRRELERSRYESAALAKRVAQLEARLAEIEDETPTLVGAD